MRRFDEQRSLIPGNSMRKARVRMSFATLCSFLLFLPVLGGESLGRFHLLKRISLDSKKAVPKGQQREYFDYITVDPAARRVYLSHGSEVMVVNADSGAVIGVIRGLKLAHGTVLLQKLGRGFISDGGNDRVVIFDLESLKTVGEIKTGGNPDCIMFDSISGHIFTFNGNSKDSSVIDPRTATVIKTIPMGGRAEFAAADDRGMIYDNIEDTSEVVAIDSRSLKIRSRWPLPRAFTPTSMAIDKQHRRLFIGGRNKELAIMNADTGTVLQTLPITAGVDTIIYDPHTGVLYVSTREAIHIFHENTPESYTEVQKVKTDYGAKTMGLDGPTRRLFLDTADFKPIASAGLEQSNSPPVPLPIPGTFRLLIYGRAKPKRE